MDPEIIKLIQAWLNIAVMPSPNLVVDGILGPKTKAAIETFLTQDVLPLAGPFGIFTGAILQLILRS